MYKFSINKDLFENILLKKITILEKEDTNYWKNELFEPVIIDDKLSYEIKQFSKLKLTNGLGNTKPQLVIECLKVDYLAEKGIFEFHLGKIIEQKNISEKLILELQNKGYKVATSLNKVANFYEAEDYHQDYYERHQKVPYCHKYKKIF